MLNRVLRLVGLTSSVAGSIGLLFALELGPITATPVRGGSIDPGVHVGQVIVPHADGSVEGSNNTPLVLRAERPWLYPVSVWLLIADSACRPRRT